MSDPGYSQMNDTGSLRCLDDHTAAGFPDECEGVVEYRFALSPTGKQFPRCDHHWALRLKEQERITRTYPQTAPADFDPFYAGESWDEWE